MKILAALLMTIAPLFASDSPKEKSQEHYTRMMEVVTPALTWAPKCRVRYSLPETDVKQLGGSENIKLHLAEKGFDVKLSHVDRPQWQIPVYHFMIGKLVTSEESPAKDS